MRSGSVGDIRGPGCRGAIEFAGSTGVAEIITQGSIGTVEAFYCAPLGKELLSAIRGTPPDQLLRTGAVHHRGFRSAPWLYPPLGLSFSRTQRPTDAQHRAAAATPLSGGSPELRSVVVHQQFYLAARQYHLLAEIACLKQWAVLSDNIALPDRGIDWALEFTSDAEYYGALRLHSEDATRLAQEFCRHG